MKTTNLNSLFVKIKIFQNELHEDDMTEGPE